MACLKHNWKVVYDTGYVQYQECRTCATRKVHFTKGVKQEVDQEWIKTGLFKPSSILPPKAQ